MTIFFDQVILLYDIECHLLIHVCANKWSSSLTFELVNRYHLVHTYHINTYNMLQNILIKRKNNGEETSVRTTNRSEKKTLFFDISSK